VLLRRERAQLTFTDHDGIAFQAILTDQPAADIAVIKRDHRARPRIEDHIRNDKDSGLRNLPFREVEHKRAWLELVRLAHDLIVWTQRLLLTGELARCEPKRLRYRLLHVAARLALHARTATLRLQASWAWAGELARRVQPPQSASRARLTSPRPPRRPLHRSAPPAPRSLALRSICG
jgi:hypothetical protein